MNKNIQKSLKEIDNLQENEPVMVGGSLEISTVVFNKYYVPLLDKVIEKKGKIHVGCAKGCDSLVQDFCVQHNYFNVTVFVPSKAKEVNYLSGKFMKNVVEGGFKARDEAMCVGCKHIIGFVSQYAGAASGTAANIISIAAKEGLFGPDCVNLDGYQVVELLRNHCVDFDEELLKFVLSKEK